MDFRFTEEQERFRQEIGEFLREALPDRSSLGPEWGAGFSREFSRKLGQKGWIGLTWPREYGGEGRSYLDRLILVEELFRYGAPCHAHRFGERQIGPALLKYGSEEQKRRFLRLITKADAVFCVGMSEPDAGSDLASVKTTALAAGDGFVINGQKVWTTAAHLADYCYLVARTNPGAPRHEGLSEFIIDLRWPGVQIVPLFAHTGEHYFNQVVLDGVFVPAECLVGLRDRGWYQIARQLDHERGGIEQLLDDYPLYEALLALARDSGLGREPLVRTKLAELAVEYEVGRLLCYRVAWLLTQGAIPNYQAAMAKLFGSEVEQHVALFATEILGLYSQLLPGSHAALLGGHAARSYLWSQTYTVGAGTSEILRMLIAVRGLGLPPAGRSGT